MIKIKKFFIYAAVFVLVLSTGCNSKNETSNKPIESKIVVNEITDTNNDNQSDTAENTNTELTEPETPVTEHVINTETEQNTADTQTEDTTTEDTQTEDTTTEDTTTENTTTVTDTSEEDNLITEASDPVNNIVVTTPEEGYDYVLADEDEEEAIAETIAVNTDTSQDTDAVLSKNNEEKSWWYSPNKEHKQPSCEKGIDFTKFDTYYVGKDSNKIYLTFDEGYENGYTPKILDILKENNVTAAFFVTKPFVTSQPALVKRMVDEGHLVCNHSVTHPNLATKTNDEIIQEIKGVEDAVIEVTGSKTAPFFRPPAGVYSERVLSVLKSQGYKTIFWSFAHRDWELDNQPPVETTIKRVMDNHHNGMILLIHAVSQSNTDALDTIIKNLKDTGYEFVSLENLQ